MPGGHGQKALLGDEEGTFDSGPSDGLMECSCQVSNGCETRDKNDRFRGGLMRKEPPLINSKKRVLQLQTRSTYFVRVVRAAAAYPST